MLKLFIVCCRVVEIYNCVLIWLEKVKKRSFACIGKLLMYLQRSCWCMGNVRDVGSSGLQEKLWEPGAGWALSSQNSFCLRELGELSTGCSCWVVVQGQDGPTLPLKNGQLFWKVDQKGAHYCSVGWGERTRWWWEGGSVMVGMKKEKKE